MNIIIVGRASAGWTAAAAPGRISGDQLPLGLLESDAIGAVGVGEATTPRILHFNSVAEHNESEFVTQTRGSFKLEIKPVRGHGDGGANWSYRTAPEPRSLHLAIIAGSSAKRGARRKVRLASNGGGEFILPRACHPLVDGPGTAKVDRHLSSVRVPIDAKIVHTPDHQSFLTRLCGTLMEAAA